MRYLLIAFLLLFLVVPSVEAGVFANLMNAIHKSVEDYNRDYLATGDAVTASLKEGKTQCCLLSIRTEHDGHV